ncbi:hypothetical protein [Solirubrobacter ginsenosidimutans]|uniref:hypothetical protein n=1 Tax=Solirubrobacter ginsenosidimutans TaxID=490573 RepID=UPI0022CDFD70|nr:hypothetical protein [Solirubrobacter ginsenosidimutans]
MLYGCFPLGGLLVFAVLASWSAGAFDDVLLVFTAAPSIMAGAVTTAGLAFRHCRRSGGSRDRAASLAVASIATAFGIGLALYAALLIYAYLYVFAA